MNVLRACVLLVSTCLLGQTVDARGAGRAFPIESENFVIDSFQNVNQYIEWDYTNFLVDLAGHYATCKAIQHNTIGLVTVDRKTPQGETIVGCVDVTDGKGHDTTLVNMYIQEVIKRWMTANLYYAQIKAAERVGCSVRPGCFGKVVIACLFTPGGPAAPSTTTTPIPRRTEEPEKNPTAPPQELIVGEQYALAFTREQYAEAESIVGKTWDRSHYLENLSGFETQCSMLGTRDWGFSYTKRVATMLNVRIVGQYGYARNKGSTQEALQAVLKTFKVLTNIREVGCSLIPHCVYEQDRQMYVVVSCLYEEF